MACPFPPALPQHRVHCWQGPEQRSHRRASLAQLMRPRRRLPMGAPSSSQRLRGHVSTSRGRLKTTQETSRGPQKLFGCFRTPQGAPGGPR
eukprot:472226-Pyramimonas_sp.AAC.1